LSVHGQRGRRERRVATVAHFDEYERVSVKHHNVDFAASPSEVPRHGPQAPVEQVSIRGVLGLPT
jgi:hypothetical protein